MIGVPGTPLREAPGLSPMTGIFGASAWIVERLTRPGNGLSAMSDSPRYASAQERLHKAIATEYELIAPESDEDAEVKGNCLLSEWVLVSNWVDEDNLTWTVTLTSPNLPRTSKIGLLYSEFTD